MSSQARSLLQSHGTLSLIRQHQLEAIKTLRLFKRTDEEIENLVTLYCTDEEMFQAQDLPELTKTLIISLGLIRCLYDELGMGEVKGLIGSARLSSKAPNREGQISGVAFHAGLLIGGAAAGIEKAVGELEKEIAIAKERRKGSKKATDARYQKDRALLVKFADAARERWTAGDNRNHYQMRKYLTDDYQDQNGKYPFSSSENIRKGMLRVLKDVAMELKRPELIGGRSKEKMA